MCGFWAVLSLRVSDIYMFAALVFGQELLPFVEAMVEILHDPTRRSDQNSESKALKG